jgi:hypothetical protein
MYLPRVNMDCHPPIYISHIAGVTGMTGSHHHTTFLVKMGSKFSPGVGLETQSS